jgi:hypothetical protein
MLPGLKLGKYSKEELEYRAMGHLKTHRKACNKKKPIN